MSAPQRLTIVDRIVRHTGAPVDAVRAMEHWAYVFFYRDSLRGYQHALKACVYAWMEKDPPSSVDWRAFVHDTLDAEFFSSRRPPTPPSAPSPPSAGSSLFACGQCGSTNVQTRQMQTRSADEPMTVFCACLQCGKRWKK